MIAIFSNHHNNYLLNFIVLILFTLSFIHLFSILKTPVLAASDNSKDILHGQDSNVSTETTNVNPACGEVIKGSVKLSSNLICSGDGLIVGEGNTQINLNGYSIIGPGKNSSKVGIMIGGHDNIIVSGYGSISGFQSGLYVSGSENVQTENLHIIDNKIALYITGTNSVDINNNMLNNNTIGIASHSNNQTTIQYNLLNGNALSGITFINTADSIINGNNIINTSNGIFLDAQSSQNKVDFNNVFNNVLDINNANNLPLNVNKNTFENNNCITSLPSGLCIGR
jgi:nitrous oxidase accessory protein NosD